MKRPSTRRLQLVATVTVAGLLSACDGGSSKTGVTIGGRTGPPTWLSLKVSSQSTVGDSGIDLVVTATVLNRRPDPDTVPNTTLTLVVATTCAPRVSFWANPGGTLGGNFDQSMMCSASSPTVQLAPGDSTVLVRRVTAAELSAMPPGEYGVTVAVTTTRYGIAASAGNVDLPLTLRP